MEKYINTKNLIVIGLDNPDCEHLLKIVPWEFIEDLPGEDVKKVERGHWITDPYKIGQQSTYCTNCKTNSTVFKPTGNMHFCPYCGARMDGGKE